MSDVTIKINANGMADLEQKALLLLESIAENIRVEAKTQCNVDTGKMRDSIRVMEGDDKFEKLIGVRSEEVPYALVQEVGSVKLNSIPSFKPYMRPALDKVIKDLPKNI